MGISVFVGILLYTHDGRGVLGVCWWHVLLLCSWVYFYIPMRVGGCVDVTEKSYTICLRVYFYIPMWVSSLCVSSMCRSYVCGYTFIYP